MSCRIETKYRFVFIQGKGQKNDGLQPKYRFGFLYISMKEMSRKIMGLAEVQIWISMNIYREIGKKNDGLELKYRFGFCWMYIEELGRKMMGQSQSTDLDLPIYIWGKYAEKSWGWLKYRFGFYWMYKEELGRKMMG